MTFCMNVLRNSNLGCSINTCVLESLLYPNPIEKYSSGESKWPVEALTK